MKRSKKLIILAGLLVVMVAAYLITALIVKKNDEASQVTETSGTYQLASFTADQVASLSWVNSSTEYKLTLTDGTWHLEGDTAFRVDSSKVDTMLSTLTSLTANKKLTGGLELSEYGLDEPAANVTVTLADGTSYTYKMGDQNAITSEYYYTVNDDLYLSDTTIKSNFAKTKNDMFAYDELPDLSSATALSLTVGDNTWEIVKLDDGSKWDYTGTHTYFLKQDDSYIPLDTDMCDALFTEATTLSWTTLQEYGASDSDVSDTYGFSAPTCIATVSYPDGAAVVSLTLEIGGAYSSYYYYARLPGSNVIYRIDDDLGDLAVAFTLNDYLDKTVLGIESTDEMNLTAAAGTYALARTTTEVEVLPEAESTEVAAEATTEPEATETAVEVTAEPDATEATEVTAEATAEPTYETVVIATCNGKEISTDAYDSLLSALNALEAVSFTDETANGTAILSCTVSTGNAAIPTVTLDFYEYNADNYLCVRSDGRIMTVDASAIDAIIRTVKTIG